jgi:hypothetical protein
MLATKRDAGNKILTKVDIPGSSANGASRLSERIIPWEGGSCVTIVAIKRLCDPKKRKIVVEEGKNERGNEEGMPMTICES